MTIILRIDGDSRSIVAYEEVSSITHSNKRAHQTVAFCRCNELSSITWGQFCLLTYPPSVKCTSSLKKILFEKLLSIACCSSTHSTYLWRVNGQLVSAVVWAGLYAVKKSWFLRITKNRHILVFGNTLTYNSALFSGTSAIYF